MFIFIMSRRLRFGVCRTGADLQICWRPAPIDEGIYCAPKVNFKPAVYRRLFWLLSVADRRFCIRVR